MTDNNLLRSPKNPNARSPFRNSVQDSFDYHDYQDVTKVGSPYGPRSQSPVQSLGASTLMNSQTNEGYEQSRMEVAALHEALQKKTFTRWMNSHLNKANQRVNNIYEDLAAGDKLALLLTLLTDEPIKLPERGHMRFHNVNNTNYVLDFIKSRKIKLVGIGAEDIVDGKKNLILGLIWTIILHFQISMIVTQSGKDPKKEIIEWARTATEGYYDVSITDLTTSWTDGLAFSALIHRHRPDLIDITRLDKNKPIENMHYAFQVAQEELYVMSLLEPEDLAKGIFDEKCTMTYLSMLKQALPALPSGSSWSEKDQLKQRYEEVAGWIQEKKLLLSKKELPATSEDCKREINIVTRTSKDCKMKENEVVSIQRFEEKIKMMTGADNDQGGYLDIDGLTEQIHLIEELSQERSAELSKLFGILEHAEELAHKAKSKLEKIGLELRALETEIRSLQTEYSSTSDSKKIEKLNKRKETATKRAEVCQTALKETEILLQSLPEVECRAVSDVRQLYSAECEHVNRVFKSLGELQPDLPDIDSLIEGIRAKTEQTNKANFPSDLTEIRQSISSHAKQQEEIDQFSQQVTMCQRVASALQGGSGAEEFSLKTQTLQTVYAELVTASRRRAEELRQLEEIVNSVSGLHDQMEVLEVKEKMRKWNPLPKPQALESELKALDKALAELDPKITALLASCKALSRHSAYTTVIQLEEQSVSRRHGWLSSLRLALDKHIRDYSIYRQFNLKCEEFESDLTKSENTLAQYAAELDCYSVSCLYPLRKVLESCEQELSGSLEELQELAATAPPYHLRHSTESVHRRLMGYALAPAYDMSGVETGNAVTITSMETNESWEVELSDGEPAMLASAILQLCPENDPTSSQRLQSLRERHSELRTVLSRKLGLVESVGELMQRVETSAEAVSSWDKSSLLGGNKQHKTEAFMDFSSSSEELLSKLPPDAPIREQVRNKVILARGHWSALTEEAASEELRDRLGDLEAWCRYWQQGLEEQAPLGITLERALEQLRWEQHLQSQFPSKFQELFALLEEAKTHTDLLPLSSSVETQLNSLQENCNKWGGALKVLKGGFDRLGEAWKWLLQLEEQLLRLSDKAMTADTQGQENLESLRQSVMEFINRAIPQHEPSLKATLETLAGISEQLQEAGGSPAIKMGAQALRHRWDLLLTEATRLDQGLGGLTKLVALLPRLAEELGQWIEEQDLEIANRDRCALQLKSLTQLLKKEDRFHKAILLKTPDFEDYSRSAQTHDQIILTITQSHQSYARTLSNARPLLSYTTEADPTATHRFQEDADRLLGQWDDLLCLSEKSLEYKQGILAALDNVMKLFAPLNEFLEEGESILGERPRALELETWLASAETFMRNKSSYQPAVGTFFEECDLLISSSDLSLVDTQPLEELLLEFKQRWSGLQLSLAERQQDCRDQIEKLRDEKTQVESLCSSLQSHTATVTQMRIVLQGLSVPAANQSILGKQKTTAEKSESELKEEERKVSELLHKLGDVSANINTELDQTEMSDQVSQLERSLGDLQQSFRACRLQVLEQDTTVQTFEPALNKLIALHREARAEFCARPGPALDTDAIRREIEFNNILRDKLAAEAHVLDKTMDTGRGVLSKASEEALQTLSLSEFHLDPQIADSYAELRAKLSGLEVDWDALSADIQQNEQRLGERAQLAREGCAEMDALLERVQTLRSELGEKGPPGAVPPIAEQQLANMQQYLDKLADIDRSVEAIKERLQINSSSPGSLAEQLARLEHEQVSLKDASAEYNEQLKQGLAVAKRYAEAHQDLKAWLQERLLAMSEWEPLGLDTQLLAIQLQSLKSFREILSRRLEEKRQQELVSGQCSAELRPSHETTTAQYSELCDLWSQLEDRIEQREGSLQQMLSLSQTFEEQVKSTSTKLVEISTDVSTLKPNIPTEPESIHSEQKLILSTKDKLDRMTSGEMLQLTSTLEQVTSLASSTEFTDQTQGVTGERDKLEKNKNSLHAMVENRLSQLEKALELATQIKTEEEAVGAWVKRADKNLDTEFTIRGVSEACGEELVKINSFHEQLEEMQTRMRTLEQLHIELSKEAAETDRARMDKSIVSLKAKVESVVNKEENVTANLQDALMEAESFESMCRDMDSYIDQASASLAELTATFNSGDPNTLEALLDNIKELLLQVVNKQLDLDRISEKGMELATKCVKDEDALLTSVANLQAKYDSLQTKAETMQREMDQAFLRAGELRKTTENLINWLKEANTALDTAPPLTGDISVFETALSTHRALATQLATKAPTIDSVLQALPSMGMSAETEELGKLIAQVREKVATRGDRIARGMRGLKQFDLRENQLRENIEIFMDQLDASDNCYGVVTVVEEISIQHEALMREIPGMEQMLDDMKEIALSLRTDNLVDRSDQIEEQLGEITLLWEAFSERAELQSNEIYNAAKTAQRLASLYTQLLNWLEPTYSEITKNTELTPNNLEAVNKRIVDMEAGLEQHRAQYEEFHQLFDQIEPRAHASGLEDLNEIKVCVTQFWTEVDISIRGKRQELEAATRGIEDIMNKLVKIAEWTDSATMDMERISDEPIPSSSSDLERIEEMILEHEKFMTELSEWHKELEPVNRVVKALQKTEKGKEMEELRKKVNKKMQILWVHASERQRHLKEAKDRIVDRQIYASFDFRTWLENETCYKNIEEMFLQQFKTHIAKSKMREGDIFRKADIINHTYLGKEDFIAQLKNTGFNCKQQEFELVAAKFEENNNLVNVDQFMKAFRPRIENDTRPDKVVINEHVMREVSKCSCEHTFRVDKKETPGGLMYQFGDNKAWRLVRILRNSVMVRVGGGWEELEKFLVKQDPCRSEKESKHLHGRINVDIYKFDHKTSSSMVQISSEYHSKIDSKTKAVEDSHKQVSVTFHDPATETTPIKSISEISHIKEVSPLPAKKLGTSAVSPSAKRKLETGTSGATSQRGSNLPTLGSHKSTQKLPSAAHGATGSTEGAKGGKLSRNSSLKDSRSTPTKQTTVKSRPKQDPK